MRPDAISRMAWRISPSGCCFEMKPWKPAARLARMLWRVSEPDMMANRVFGETSNACLRRWTERKLG